MKKWQMIAVCLFLSVFLAGCGLEWKAPVYIAKRDEGIEAWTMEDATSGQQSNVTSTEQGISAGPLPEIELEADILGIYEILDEAEGERPVATSQLVAGKEYEVTARILLSAENEGLLGQELDFLLTCPTVVEKGKKVNFGIGVYANGIKALTKEFAVTATAHDLRVGYMPATYRITQNDGVPVELTTSDVVWSENVELQEQSLDYLTRIDHQVGIYEYLLRYQVQTEVLEDQQQEVAEQMAEPILIRLKGLSQQYLDDKDKSTAWSALNDCLRDIYMMPETIYSDGSVYLVVEVYLPEWAREYAEKYGLLVTWYNYAETPGCGVGVSLPAFPENLGHVEVSLENLVLKSMEGSSDEIECSLVPYPSSPLSIWCDDLTSVIDLKELTMVTMSDEMTEDTRASRSYGSYVLGSEVVQQIPETGWFYVVVGTELIDGGEGTPE